MRVNMSIEWQKAPANGRVHVSGGALSNALINVGWGTYDLDAHRFAFTSTTEPCRLCFAVDVPAAQRATVHVTETSKPFEFDLLEVMQQSEGRRHFPEIGVTVTAESDVWASL